MSTEFNANGPIDSTEAFENALLELVQTAQANGVDPAGFYESRRKDGHTDFEIAILELAKKDT